jgi:hypothetical protein
MPSKKKKPAKYHGPTGLAPSKVCRKQPMRRIDPPKDVEGQQMLFPTAPSSGEPPVEEPPAEETLAEETSEEETPVAVEVNEPPAPARSSMSPPSTPTASQVFPGSPARKPWMFRIPREDKVLLEKVGDRLNLHICAMVMRDLCTQCYHMFGNYQEWNNQTGRYIPEEVYERVSQLEFQAMAWPKVLVLLKDNRFNVDWTMKVLIQLAVQDVISRHAELLLRRGTA